MTINLHFILCGQIQIDVSNKQFQKSFIFQVVPYKECKQGLEQQEFSETVLAPKKFIEKECVQNKKEIPHKKLLPECKNVTKQNCVTNWETDSYGNQVRVDYSR